MKSLAVFSWCILITIQLAFTQEVMEIAPKSELQVLKEDTAKIAVDKRIIWRRDKGDLPILNAHRFIDNALVIDPFNKTSFRLRMGYGNTPDIQRPDLDTGDTLIERRSGQLLYGSLGFQFELRVKDWVSFFLKANGLARVGSDPISLFSNGLNTAVETQMGWKIRLFENDHHYLSTMASISRGSASLTNILEFASDIVMGDSASLTTKLSALRGAASIQYAVAIGEMIGVQLVGTVSGGDLIETGRTGILYSAGIAADLNLYPRTNTPLGFSFAYSHSSIPEFSIGKFNRSPMGNLKIAYTGSKSFIISADVTVSEAKYLLLEGIEIKEVNTNLKTYSLNLLVYFN